MPKHLDWSGNYNLTAGVYDAASGHLFLLLYNSSLLDEINPATAR